MQGALLRRAERQQEIISSGDGEGGGGSWHQYREAARLSHPVVRSSGWPDLPRSHARQTADVRAVGRVGAQLQGPFARRIASRARKAILRRPWAGNSSRLRLVGGTYGHRG